MKAGCASSNNVQMKLFFPVLLVGACAIANAEDTMDLYIREKFASSAGDQCGSCAETDECFLSTRSFFLQNSCFNRNDERASVYNEVEEGVVCRQEFRGDSCEDDGELAFDAEDAEEDCRDAWNVDECTGSERMQKLSGWCTSSAAGPVGEFTVPMLTFKEYDDVEDCGSGDYLHLLLPDEGGTCIPLSFPSRDGPFITGSRRVSCSGSVFSAVRYESADCSGEAIKTPFDGISDVCPASSNAPGAVFTNDCSAPAIYCKSLTFSGITIGDVQVDDSASDAATDSGATETDRNTSVGEALGESAGAIARPSSLFFLGAALLSLVV